MAINTKYRKVIGLYLSIIIILAFIFFYKKYISSTKVGLVNYPVYLYTKIAKSNTSSFIDVVNLRPDSLPNLNSYDMLIVFGMGIRLPEEQEMKIIQAVQKGTGVYLQASTDPGLQLTNIKGRQLDNISGYLDYGGKNNYRNMLNYIRKEIDGKLFFNESPTEPEEIPSDVLFHIDEDVTFETVDAYEKYCAENGFHREGQEKIILFTSVPGPFNANRDHLNSLIDELQSRQLNIYPIAGFGGRLDYMKEINPSLIVYMPHGRLSFGGGSARAVEGWLEKQNVPVLCPVSVMQKYEDWLKDKQGMTGGYLSQSVTMPEFDGGILPYTVFAQYEDKNGYLIFRAIPDRLKKFGDIVDNYLKLQRTDNYDKKLAVVYYKGPGKNSLEASNMEVLPSLHNLLLRLQMEGYNLEGLPGDYTTFKKLVMQKGPVLGPYANGAFEEFIKKGDPELVRTTTYQNWCKEVLPAELYEDVNERYGNAPGAYMSVYKDTIDYLAIARLKFGNIVLLPQPLPGIGENEFQLIHGAKVAPPHSYIAPYLWIQKGFGADAIFHFGTHGSLEFTPGKQIALSDHDWTDPLIGTIPHYYVYTISNVGEGMIAKRRSYAVTQTYLTPPFIEAQALEGRKIMHNKIHKYGQATGALKREYALSIKELAVREGIHTDLGLDGIITEPYNEDEMMKLSNYLEEIEHEKVTGGLYTMGIPYTTAKLDETIQLMLVDALAYNLAELDVIKGVISRSDIDNKMFFNDRYTHPCESYIHKTIETGDAHGIFSRIVAPEDYARADRWQQRSSNMKKHPNHGASINKEVTDSIATDLERDLLRTAIVQILPDPKKKEFLLKLESDKEYEKAISLLDPNTRNQSRKIAKFIPAMAEALKVAEDSTVQKILTLIQKPELRVLALEHLQNGELASEVAREKIRQDSILLLNALDESRFFVTRLQEPEIIDARLETLEDIQAHQDFYLSERANLLNILEEEASVEKEDELVYYLQNSLMPISEKVNKRLEEIKNIETSFAHAVFTIKSTLQSVLEKREQLNASPEHEMRAILNALNGGYTAPSPGGDPVANPATIPTGRNLYSISAETTPSKEAWRVGKKLAEDLLMDYRKKHDDQYPKKISFTLWSSSFIESEGTTIAQILYLLGTKPVWTPFGRVKDVKLIPMAELGRPRIDVVVQTSGQLRDLAASRLFIIDRAIAMAASEDEEMENYVAKGVLDAERLLIEKGFSPKQARELSAKRIFGGVNGNYGTGIMGMVENSGRWDSTRAVALTYINNMGAIYGQSEEWGEFNEGLFEAALLNTEAVVHPRQSNTWGALSLDHVYEFMGGLNLAVKEVTGNDAESYFNDFRNSSNPRIQSLNEAIWVESRTTLLNARYIKEYMKGGASSAETFAETFRNTFGWNVMKPTVIENRLWDKLYEVYVRDEHNLDIHDFFKSENPYALQEMTAVMLESVRKGMWKATGDQIAEIANLHAQLIRDHEAGCSGFVCNNQKLKDYISSKLNPELEKDYRAEIARVREATQNSKENIVLKKDEKMEINQSGDSFSINQMVLVSSIVLLGLLIILFVRKRRGA